MTALTTLLVLIALALAIWGWRNAPDPSAFFAASRAAGPVLAGLAGTAAGLSAFVFIGGPALFASVGVASLWLILSAPLTGVLQCLAVGEPILDIVRRTKCLTVPELLAARFGEGWPRGLAAVIVCAGAVTTLGVQIKGTAVLGETLLGVQGWLVAAVAVLATTLYTAAGGMRSGIIAEAAQGALMAAAAVVLTVAVFAAAGGPVRAAALIQRHRPELLDPLAGGQGGHFIGLFLLFAIGTCAQPHYLQKFLMLRSRADLRWLPVIMTAALLSVLTVWIGVGLGGTALWIEGAVDPGHPEALAPTLLAQVGGPALAIFAAIAVVAAVMSTAASLLNIAAAAVTLDLPKALGRKPPQSLTSARLMTVVVAGLAGILALQPGSTVVLLGILGWSTFTAGLLPVIVVGLRWSQTSRRGAIAAILTGPTVQIGLEILTRLKPGLITLQPGLTGAAAGTLVLVALSMRRSDPDERA